MTVGWNPIKKEGDMRPRRSRVLMALVGVVLLLAVGVASVRVFSARRQESPKGATSVVPDTTADGEVSFHGRDRSTSEADGTALVTCDLERDGNPVKGVYDFDTATSGGDGAIEDLDGAGGRCARIETRRVIVRHRTCERNHVAWDCDNWVDSAAP